MFLSALFPFFTQERILLDLTPFFLLELDFKTKQFIVGTIKPDQGTPTMTPFPVQITDW